MRIPVILQLILQILVLSPLSATIATGRRRHFLQEVRGRVAGAAFSYFAVTFEGPLTLLLRSTAGDADVYVAGNDSLPTWEPHSYSLQSSSCGEDVVFVPPELPRPLNVGVYGHPSYAHSDFHLRLYCHHQTPDGQPFAGNGDAAHKMARGTAVCRPRRCPAGSAAPQGAQRAREAPDALPWPFIWMPLAEVLGFFFALL